METSSDRILRQIYYNPRTGLSSAVKLYKLAKEQDSSITRKQTEEFIKKQSVAQILRERKIKHHFPLIADRPFDRVQIDLLDVRNENPNVNGGCKYIFLLIDVFSRIAFARPIKSKTNAPILESLQSIIAEIEKLGYRVRVIDSDNESGFKSNVFAEYCESKQITQNLNDPGDHHALGVIDRFCRTLRGYINKYTLGYQTQKFVPVLGDLIDNYNNSVNRTLGVSPVQSLTTGGANSYMTKQTAKAKQSSFNKEVLNVGDTVRIMKKKKLFEKGGTTFTKTLHKIKEIKNGLYFVNDRDGGYRKSNLLKVSESEDYIPENVDLGREIREQVVDRRVNRRIQKEGVERKEASTEEEKNDRALRRYRNPRQSGFMINDF